MVVARLPEGKETVSLDKKNGAGWIRFDRPERMNALSPQSLRELWALLGKLEADTQIRVAVFTGRGGAFCAGMDMVGMESISPLAARRRSREMQMLTKRISELSLPTIAAVNGVAMGAGLETCLVCDLVLASSAARFAFPEVRLGMIPCGGGTQRLARLIGLRRAREMILTGKILDAEQALAWGLVNEVVEPRELEARTEKLVEKLAQGGRFALLQAKRCLNHSMDMGTNRGLEYETECFTTCFSTAEPASGLKRFAASKEGAESNTASREEEPEEGEAVASSGATAPPSEAVSVVNELRRGDAQGDARGDAEGDAEGDADEDEDIWE